MSTTLSKKYMIDDRIRKISGKSVKGIIGIEHELECVPSTILQESNYWVVKQEPSLRDGVEFTLRYPLDFDHLEFAIKQFSEAIEKIKTVRKSIRCSTHIHVNVQKLTQREVYNALAFYYLVEDILVQTQGPLRIGNLFCLRMSDANSIATDLKTSIKTEQYFRYFNKSDHKYGALNLSTPRIFGSLEFRFFRPMIEPDLLMKWCRALHGMILESSKIPAEEWLKIAINGSPLSVMSRVFDQEFLEYLTEGLTDFELSEMFLRNFDDVHTFVSELGSKKYFKLPLYLIEDDITPLQEWVDEFPEASDPITGEPTEDFLTLEDIQSYYDG